MAACAKSCLQLGLGGHYQGATQLTIQSGKDEFTFVFSGPTCSQGLYHYDIAQRRLTELVAPREVRDDLHLDERYATAPDGARVCSWYKALGPPVRKESETPQNEGGRRSLRLRRYLCGSAGPLT